jgi:hypothetical protein
MSSTWQFQWDKSGLFAITEYEIEQGDGEAPIIQRVEIPRDVMVGFVESIMNAEDNAWYEVSDEPTEEIYDE